MLMQRETCRLQPETPRRTVPRLRTTLLSVFPARPPAAPRASGRCSGRHRAELQGGGPATPPGSAACPSRVPQRLPWPVMARYSPLVASTPSPGSHPYPYRHPGSDHVWAGRRIVSSPSPLEPAVIHQHPAQQEHPRGVGFLGSLPHPITTSFLCLFISSPGPHPAKQRFWTPGFPKLWSLLSVPHHAPSWAQATLQVSWEEQNQRL